MRETNGQREGFGEELKKQKLPVKKVIRFFRCLIAIIQI